MKIGTTYKKINIILRKKSNYLILVEMVLNNTSRGLLKENSRILFIEYNINDEIFYSLPGGKVEMGESLKECLIREFSEETGINVEVKELILLNEFTSPNPNSISERWKNGIHQIESIFRVERIEQKDETINRELDIGMQAEKWISIDELKNVKYYPEKSVNWFFVEKYVMETLYKFTKY